MKVKTIFIGSGEFAVPILDWLLHSDLVELQAVITQPEKPVGRRKVLTPTPVGEFLQKGSVAVPVETPAKIRLEASDLLNKYQPELIIVASYGQIIPEELLNYPKYKTLNIHGSILPQLRGAVPVQMAILNGFKTSGVSIQRMVYQMDAGPLISIRETKLDGTETTDTLMQELSVLGTQLLAETLPDWLAGKIEETPQNESEATYCYKDDLSKDKAEIKFETDINLAERMIRSFFPWPVAWVNRHGKMIKIFRAIISDNKEQSESLKFVKKEKKLLLCLQNGTLEVLELQEEGKSRDDFKNYFYLAGK